MATVYDWHVPTERNAWFAWATRILSVVAGSAFIAMSAQWAVPIPFSPVPITGQTFGVLVVGLLLGSRLGTAAVVAYLVEGLAGLPVLAPGGVPGIARFLSPAGGYLVGFIPGVWLIGRLVADHARPNLARSLAGLTAGSTVILLAGVAGLTFFMLPAQAVAVGMIPFLPGEVLKVVLAVPFLRLARRIPSTRSRL